MSFIILLSYIGIMMSAIGSVLLSKDTESITNKWKIYSLSVSISFILLVCFILQVRFPPILILFQRNTSLITAGEGWRLLTPLLFQDGGFSGALFNIITLLIIGGLAEKYWKRTEWFVIFFSGYFFSTLIALWWQPIGAGNSTGNFSLAASILLINFVKNRNVYSKLLGIFVFLVAVLLCIRQDIHGVAFLIGTITSALFIWKEKRNT